MMCPPKYEVAASSEAWMRIFRDKQPTSPRSSTPKVISP
jgi:hypothetical protein